MEKAKANSDAEKKAKAAKKRGKWQVRALKGSESQIIIKRPSSSSVGQKKKGKGNMEGHEKKASELATWAESQDDDAEEVDERPITKEQRHVWGKAMAALPGTPNALPPDIKSRADQLKTSRAAGKTKIANALVNSIVPRNVKYSTTLNFKNPATLEKYEKFSDLFFVDKVCHGISETKMIGECGGGDVGREEMKKGIEKGDIVKKTACIGGRA